MDDLHRVRIYDPISQKEEVISTTLDNIINHPTGLNMADVGIILLNKERVLKNLEPISAHYIADSIEDLKTRGSL